MGIYKMNDILQFKGYYAEIHFSADDEVFFGKLLGISDLVSFEGASVSELKKAFHEAVEDYLETCTELGKEPEKTYKGSFNVRISPELHRKAANYASIRKLTLNELVKQAIDGVVSKPFHIGTI
jgi:predicted HicB family RNase H-like nuclease